jgi:hypothetical protein
MAMLAGLDQIARLQWSIQVLKTISCLWWWCRVDYNHREEQRLIARGKTDVKDIQAVNRYGKIEMPLLTF